MPDVPLFIAMPRNEKLASDLASLTRGRLAEIEIRSFPDGESYVRVLGEVRGRDVFVVCTLARPDPQLLPLSFAAAAAASLGANSVRLIAPYLAYMRQDRIFHSGEALTSRLFAQLLQQHFDGLITVDPHLHRHRSLDEIYDIGSTIVHVAPLFARWIATNVEEPIVIGPDAESAQWVEEIAIEAGAPWGVFTKRRRGDRSVEIAAGSLEKLQGRTPVLVDDIVSSGTTLKSALAILSSQDFKSPYCLAIHALCSSRTALAISKRSAGLLTSNTVPNDHACFDVAPLIADNLICA